MKVAQRKSQTVDVVGMRLDDVVKIKRSKDQRFVADDEKRLMKFIKNLYRLSRHCRNQRRRRMRKLGIVTNGLKYGVI
jgi:hypothetical protein